MGRFVGAVRHNGLYTREFFGYLIVNIVKSYAVMHIPGGYYGFKDISVFITGCVCFVRELTLVVSLYKKTALRVGCASCYRFHLLSASKLLL